MNKQDEQLLLKDISARLPYGVKLMYEGWDSDGGCEFTTVETLIGVDDKFIYTIWDKTGEREKHCLSVLNWKLYLRPMSSMTEEELEELFNKEDIDFDGKGELVRKAMIAYSEGNQLKSNSLFSMQYAKAIDWLNAHSFDYRGLIKKGLAIESPEGMYNRKT